MKNEWWKEAVVYQIYPRSFKDSNGDGIGDIRGIIEKLDYLNGSSHSLGIEAIWLSPIYPSPMVDFGYDISDYQSIDPTFGTLNDFQELIEEAQKRNIKIIMDLVANHTSDQHPWFIESRSSRDNAKRDWYIWKDPKKNKEPNNWLAVFGGSAWAFDEKTGQYYLHSFAKEQPDLNWRNPEVQKAIFSIIEYWLDMGVAGFRLDVVNCFVKDKQFRDNESSIFKGLRAYDRQYHIHDRDQPEMHSILKSLRKLLDSRGCYMSVGEIFIEPPGSVVIPASYYGENDELHLAFNFLFMNSIWAAFDFADHIAEWDKALPDPLWPCYFLSNHDFTRHITRYSNDKHDVQRAKLAAFILLTVRGTPFLYYGEEIGLETESVPKEYIQDPPGKKYWPFYKGRDGTRLPMPWDDSNYGGFSRSTPWLPLFSKYKTVNVAAQVRDQDSLFYTYKQLIQFRKENETLLKGSLTVIDIGHKKVLCYKRVYQSDILLVLLNFGSKLIHLDLSNLETIKDKELSIIFSTRSLDSDIERLNTKQFLLYKYEGIIIQSV
jgi:alpha-glucosidase